MKASTCEKNLETVWCAEQYWDDCQKKIVTNIGNTQMLHIVSNCQVALDRGCYTWCHNSVLSNLIRLICPKLLPGAQLFSDLPGFLAPGGGSIPPHVLVTNQKPDIFIVNGSSHEAVVFELTCPWDDNISRSHSFKEEKYAPLIADLSQRYKTYLFSVEISVRGQVSGDNKKRLKAFTYRVSSDPKLVFKSMVKILSKTALLSSFSIFSARAEPSWISPPFLDTH